MTKAFQACFRCEDRYPGCHGSCEAYQNEKQQYESFRDRERASKRIEYDLMQDYRRRIRKK